MLATEVASRRNFGTNCNWEIRRHARRCIGDDILQQIMQHEIEQTAAWHRLFYQEDDSILRAPRTSGTTTWIQAICRGYDKWTCPYL